MNTYFKALLKCKYPVELTNKWLMPAKWLSCVKLSNVYFNWFLNSYKWHEETKSSMLSHSRVFLGYDGALSCAGRDTDEFINDCTESLDESLQYFIGEVAPRVEMNIAFDNPDKYPYQYIKWATRLNIYSVTSYIRNNYTWISFSVLLVLINILTLLIKG